jgi:putative endonuclease
MPTPAGGARRQQGAAAEQLAAQFLERQGYRILARHYTCSLGELDLVALDGACLVFVEVRSLQKQEAAVAAASVDAAKQRRLARLALAYLQRYHLLDKPARFDVIALGRSPQGDWQILHYPNAFSLEVLGD